MVMIRIVRDDDDEDGNEEDDVDGSDDGTDEDTGDDDLGGQPETRIDDRPDDQNSEFWSSGRSLLRFSGALPAYTRVCYLIAYIG